MLNPISLIEKTSAYKTIIAEKNSGRLSHAYMLVCQDKKFLRNYLKIFAKTIVCVDKTFCDNCRNCKLIDGELHPDVIFYPKGESVTTADINNLTEESFVKPVESDKKVFVIDKGETMNLSAQNKLLKTLEEPPKNVVILIGVTSEFPILSTVKSRVKKLEINAFTSSEIYGLLSSEYDESDKLKQAVACGDGTLGKAIDLYNGEDFEKILTLVKDVLLNMKTSRDVLKYSNLIADAKIDYLEFLSVLELTVRDMTVRLGGSESSVFNGELSKELEKAEGFTLGALVFILERINEAYKRKKFNNNQTMLSEWLLFSILEGKHKWQKS